MQSQGIATMDNVDSQGRIYFVTKNVIYMGTTNCAFYFMFSLQNMFG